MSSSGGRRAQVTGEWCAYCKKNGEPWQVFSSHSLHVHVCGTKLTVCPILQQHVCEICGATGVLAHSRSHCPEKPERSAILSLKRTTHRSDGQRRRPT